MRNNGNYNGINYNGRLAKTLDLLNADGLDDSITEVYESDIESDEETSGLITELIAGNKSKKALKGITGCKKPLFMIGKKKEAYNQCLLNFKTSVEKNKRAAEVSGMETASKQAELDSVKKELEKLKNAQTPMSSPNGSSSSREAGSSEMSSAEPKKFLGMPKAVGITVVSVVGAGLLGLGAYLIFRKK